MGKILEEQGEGVEKKSQEFVFSPMRKKTSPKLLNKRCLLLKQYHVGAVACACNPSTLDAETGRVIVSLAIQWVQG